MKNWLYYLHLLSANCILFWLGVDALFRGKTTLFYLTILIMIMSLILLGSFLLSGKALEKKIVFYWNSALGLGTLLVMRLLEIFSYGNFFRIYDYRSVISFYLPILLFLILSATIFKKDVLRTG
ncbi:MAG: hypothetical protein KDD99_21980 [Bacteroidetes bacterium]|nr:hypothetical protein [Bacteroidota bacterium]